MKSTDKKGSKKKSGNGNRGITQLGVLIEDVRDDVKLIAEQYGDIKNALNTHTAMFEQHRVILEQHRVILDRHTAKLDAHTEMIGNMAMDVEVIKMDIAFIKSGLKKKVDEEEFRALEKRVAILEKRK